MIILLYLLSRHIGNPRADNLDHLNFCFFRLCLFEEHERNFQHTKTT